VYDLVPSEWRLGALRGGRLGPLFEHLERSAACLWGHVIGVAAAHLTRVLPDLATMLAWRSCDHLGPTFEGELLHSEIAIDGVDPLEEGSLVELRVRVSTLGEDEDERRPVVDWRLTALMP
jgi:hypothetical protein